MTDNNFKALPLLHTSVRVPDRVLMRLVGEELVLLNLEKENYYGLNPVGARLMQLAETGATLEGIVERMLTEFEVERAQLEVDVRAVAANLIAAGLLEEAVPA
jgi:hypothetical protein